ncbi:hypothetical protein R6Q57_022627 [Mikania cordata]
MSNYLVDNDHPNGLKLHHQTPKIIDLPWKTINNGVDCGVFCMRHMETYIGGGVKGRRCGLVNESDAQCKKLNQLMRKYLCKILTSSVNLLKDDVLVQAITHDGLDPKKKQWPKTILRKIKTTTHPSAYPFAGPSPFGRSSPSRHNLLILFGHKIKWANKHHESILWESHASC